MASPREALASLRNRMASIRKKGERKAGTVMNGLLIVTTCAADGYVRGRYPDKATVGDDKIGIDLIVGLGALGMSLGDGLGRYEEQGAVFGSVLIGLDVYRRTEAIGVNHRLNP